MFPPPKMTTQRVIEGDCLIEMAKLPAESIDIVLTSPPYDNLRDYKGYSFDFEGIARELWRVIAPGGGTGMGGRGRCA